MRKTNVLAAAVVAAFFVVGGSATADPGNGNGAVVVKTDNGLTCWVNIGGWPATTSEGIYVATPSGNTLLRCHFRSVANPPATAFRLDGWPCLVSGKLTYDSHFVIGPGGNATMTCELRTGT